MIRTLTVDLGGTLVPVNRTSTTATLARLLSLDLPRARALMGELAKRRRCTPSQLAEELATRFTSTDPARLRQVLKRARDRATAPPLYPDAAPALAQLRSRGLRLVAVTNSLGCTVPADPVAALGDVVDHVVYSADVGATKPDSDLFRHIEHATNSAAHELVHVGDSARSDAAAALACGWSAVWLDRTGANPHRCPPGAAYATTLADLPRLLEGDG